MGSRKSLCLKSGIGLRVNSKCGLRVSHQVSGQLHESNHLGTRPIISERYIRPRDDPSTKSGIPMEWYVIYRYLSLFPGSNLGREDLFRPSDLLLESSFQAISGLVLLFCPVCLFRKLNLCHAYDMLSLEILSAEQRCSTITWLGSFCSSTNRTRQPCVAVQLLIV